MAPTAQANGRPSEHAGPVLTGLMNNVQRVQATAEFDRAVKDPDATHGESVEGGDEDGAGRVMEDHLEFLRPHYTRAWVSAARRSSR